MWSTYEKNNWYALFVKTGCEDTIAKNLSGLFSEKYDFCVPKRLLKIRSKGKQKTEIRTLFPGYILIHGMLSKEDYYLIKKIKDIYYFIMSDDHPHPIDQEEINPIIRLMGNSKFEIIGESSIFMKDDRIYVKEGPLKTLDGIIVSVNIRKQRAKVRLTIGGAEKLVDLSVNIINHA